jgi:hypothetical protein
VPTEGELAGIGRDEEYVGVVGEEDEGTDLDVVAVCGPGEDAVGDLVEVAAGPEQ